MEGEDEEAAGAVQPARSRLPLPDTRISPFLLEVLYLPLASAWLRFSCEELQQDLQDEPSLQQAGCAKGQVSSEAPRLSVLLSFQVCSTPDCCVITALLQR